MALGDVYNKYFGNPFSQYQENFGLEGPFASIYQKYFDQPQPDLPGNLQGFEGGMFTGDSPQPEPDDSWYVDYLKAVGSGLAEYTVGGAADLLDLAGRSLPETVKYGMLGAPGLAYAAYKGSQKPSLMSEAGKESRESIRDLYEENREGLSEHGVAGAGALSLASDIGALGLDAILTGGLTSGPKSTPAKFVDEAAQKFKSAFDELAEKSLAIAPEIPPEASNAAKPIEELAAEALVTDKRPDFTGSSVDDFLMKDVEPDFPANENIPRSGLHVADELDATKNYTIREPQEGLPGYSGKPPTIREPFEGTPRDIKYKFYGNRQVADYEAATHNIEMRKKFGDKNLEDATFYLEGTGNPYAEKPFNSHADVVARLRSTPQGQELMRFVDEEWPQRTKELYDSIKSLGFADDMGYIENYIKHVWEAPDLEAKRFAQFLKTSDPFMKGRHIPTYEEGIARGFQPRTVNFADLAALTERAYGNVKAAHTLLDEVHRLGSMPDGLPAVAFGVPEKGAYKKVNIPAIAKLFTSDDEAAKTVYMHNDLWEELKPVLTVSDVTKVDEAIATVKAFNLSFSFFHPFTLLESSVSMFGPVKGTAAWAGHGAGIPYLSKLTKPLAQHVADVSGIVAKKDIPVISKAFEDIATVMGEIGIDVGKDGMMNGLNVGRPETDVMQGAFFQSMDKIARQAAKVPVAGKALYKSAKFLKYAKKTFDTALWDNLDAPLKVSGYQFALSRLKKGTAVPERLSNLISSMFGSKKISELSEVELKRAAARWSNSEFGGQAWELKNSKFWSNPRVQRMLRRVFTSPDWNVSSVEASVGAFSRDPAIRAQGIRHYINLGIGYYAMLNMANYAMSGHFMWDNEPGKEFHLETWYTKPDSKGRERKQHWNVLKQAGEMIELAVGRETSSGEREKPVVGFLARKVLPIWQAMFSIAAGKSISGFPSEETQLREKKGRPLTGSEKLGATAKQLGKSVLPFNVQRGLGEQKMSPGEYLIPYPQSSGMNKMGATNRLYEAYKNSDAEEAQRVIDSLYDNGYTTEDVEDAISEAQKMLLK